MITAQEALERLKQGNKRFVSGNRSALSLSDHQRREELVVAQKPMAVVLGCSDSRVPTELIFDQGLGDLFVVRVAGNIASETQIGSIEFAVQKLGVRFVLVLGHSNCGAVTLAIDALQSKTMVTPGLNSVIQPIQQAVATFKGYGSSHLDEAVSANVRNSVALLKSKSPLLGDFIREEGLLIAGGQYRLESGVVDFFND